MSDTYALNLYFDSWNPGSAIANPSTPPGQWVGQSGGNWYNPQHWEWQVQQNDGTWASEGSGILDVSGANSLTLGFFDSNVLDPSASDTTSASWLNNVAVQLVLNFSSAPPSGLSLTTSSTPNLSLSVSAPVTAANQVTYVVYANLSPAQSSSVIQPGYSTNPQAPPNAAVWSIALTPNPALSDCTAEVSVWLQFNTADQTAPVCYCIDPEMQMDGQ